MVQIGDRFLLKPAHCPEEFHGRPCELYPGTVTDIKKGRFAIVEFDGGWRESFPLYGSDDPYCICNAPRAGKKVR